MSTPRLVRDQVRALVADALAADERVLVLGATGWLGSTMLALLDGHPATVLPVASRARTHVVGDRGWDVRAWDDDAIAAFAPTTVLNFAFLTREKEQALGTEGYASALAALNARLVATASAPSVRAVLTVSSGAAVHLPEGPDLPIGPYGQAKREEERLALGLVTAERSVVVARAWSLSGVLVQRPHDYAFSDLVLQARTGRIAVSAPGEVWRRYVGADDYLAVAVAGLLAGRSGVVDSGGPEVELRDLAARIADRYPGPRPTVEASAPSGPVRRYASDDATWTRACAAAGFVPAGLDEQIDLVQAGLDSSLPRTGLDPSLPRRPRTL